MRHRLDVSRAFSPLDDSEKHLFGLDRFTLHDHRRSTKGRWSSTFTAEALSPGITTFPSICTETSVCLRSAVFLSAPFQ